MKYCFFVFLFFACLNIGAQDRILTRDFENTGSMPASVKLLSNFRDTLTYSASGVVMKIAAKDVIAIRENYEDKNSAYVYLRPDDERIFGIRNDQLFYKADYRFTTSNAELAKECFLAKYRIYNEDIRGDLNHKLFICNDSTDEDVKLPESVSFYVSVKGDMLNRNIKARLYRTSPDATELIVKIEANKTDYIYKFKSGDIKALGIESPGAHTGRMAVNIMSMGRSLQYHNDKWFTRYEFGKWHFCH